VTIQRMSIVVGVDLRRELTQAARIIASRIGTDPPGKRVFADFRLEWTKAPMSLETPKVSIA